MGIITLGELPNPGHRGRGHEFGWSRARRGGGDVVLFKGRGGIQTEVGFGGGRERRGGRGGPRPSEQNLMGDPRGEEGRESRPGVVSPGFDQRPETLL